MSRSAGLRSRLGRAAATVVIAALMSPVAAVAAVADTAPTPDPLASALKETASVADEVAAAQKAYAAATSQLAAVQHKLSAAVEASGLAQDALAARTADADVAAQDAARAAGLSADSDRWLRQQAALIYQGSPSDSLLSAVFGPDGPQTLSDLQVGMTAVLARNQNALIRAEALASDASRLSERADDARAHQVEVAKAAQEARVAIQAVVKEAQAETAKLAAEQQALLKRLATLRSTAAALERKRQDELAAAEQKRQDELAALAGLRASSTSAASPAKLYDSGGGRDLTQAQRHPQAVAQAMLVADGFGADQWPCLDRLWTSESGWNWAASNATSGAYGIPQALPGSKMASAGADWLVNPATQIRWGLTYIVDRYGSPCQAWSTWQGRSPHWY